jgi:nucleotide-binding universal stress UspA family protein
MSQPYNRESPELPNGSDYLVMLPVIDSDEALRLMPLATAVARQHGGRVGILRVVVVPEDQPLSDGVLEARRIRSEMDAIAAFNGGDEAPVRPIVNVAHSLTEGIRTAAEEQRAALLLLGWQAGRSSAERLFGPPIDDLLRQPPCDVAVARLHEQASEAGRGTPVRRVLLPVRGGPHTPLACDMALALAEREDAMITVLYASNPRSPDNLAARESLQSLRTMPRVARWLERAIPAEQAILAEAGDHQVIVLGVTGRRGDPEAPAGPLADQILRHAPATVVLVRHRMAQSEEQAQQIWQQVGDSRSLVRRKHLQQHRVRGSAAASRYQAAARPYDQPGTAGAERGGHHR